MGAARSRQSAQGTEAVGRLSSPKRHLCDVCPVNQEWRFPDRDDIQLIRRRSGARHPGLYAIAQARPVH